MEIKRKYFADCLLIFILVLHVGNSQMPADWYLSSDGHDTSSCGDSASNACGTLDWLLDRFYRTSYKINPTLSVITDSNLTIDQNVVERNEWLQNLAVLICSTKIPSLKSNISVLFQNVAGTEGDWRLTDVNLAIKQSDLRRVNFTVRMTGNENNGFIVITNSTWGHLNALRGFEIHVSDCYYTDIRTVIPLLVTTSCKVTVTFSTFGQDMKHFESLALLNGTSTDAQMINTSFILGLHRDNDGPVIQINTKSKLHMENCSVQFNEFVCGSVVVFTKSSSEATFINCVFFQKDLHRINLRRKYWTTHMRKLRCFPISENGSEIIDNETSISQSNSTFDIAVTNYLNHAITIDKSRVFLFGCIFNSVEAVFFAQDNSEIKAVGCKFHNGSDLAYATHSTKFSFFKCTFVQWKSLLGLIFNSVTYIDHCNLTLNEATEPWIGLVEMSKVYLRNSHIKSNSFESNFLVAKPKSLFVMEYCSYISNIGYNDSSHFSFSDNTDVIVRNNNFFNNIGLESLIHIKSSSIHFEETNFHEKDQHMVHGLLTGTDSHVNMEKCSIYCDPTGNGCGLAFIIALDGSVLNINNSSFNFNAAIHVESASKSVNVANSVFHQTLVCGAFLDDINIEGCNFNHSGVVLMGVSVSRIANSRFFGNSKPAIRFSQLGGDDLHLKTWNTTIKWKNFGIKSNMKNFVKRAEKEGFIDVEYPGKINHTETVFASLIPVRCQTSASNRCHCYYSQAMSANTYKCSTPTNLSFPSKILESTNWLILENSNIIHLCDWLPYLTNIHFLTFKRNNIQTICDLFLMNLSKSKCLSLDLSDNRLNKLPKTMLNLTHLEKLWLSKNPYHCDCSMTWMAKWLNNFKTSAGKHVIVDYQNVTCRSGMMIGKPIHLLDGVEMGCFSSKITLWEKLRIGVGIGTVMTMILIITIIVRKRMREVKFLMFNSFNLVSSLDKDEDVDGMEYDAFFCYSHQDTKWVSDVFMKNKKKRSRKFDLERKYGFRLCIHRRNWIAGRTIRANIVDSMEKSRKIIFLLSRNFLKSKWGMEEFMIADAEVVNGRKNFIIIIMKDKMNMEELTKELRTYIRTYTYIDATKEADRWIKRLRFSLPRTPLRDLKPELFENEYLTECVETDSDDARSSVSEESDDIQSNDTTVESDEFENDNQNNDLTDLRNVVVHAVADAEIDENNATNSLGWIDDIPLNVKETTIEDLTNEGMGDNDTVPLLSDDGL